MWENRTYTEELRKSMYAEKTRPPEFRDVIRKQTGPLDPNYPYPVFEISRSIDLHVVPIGREHRLWAVEKSTEEVLGKYSGEEFFWYDDEQATEAVRVLRDKVPGAKQGSGFVSDLRTVLQTELTREFDDQLSQKLQPALVRVLKEWTSTVDAEEATYPGQSTVRRTEWTIRLDGNKATIGDWEATYTTEQLCQQSPEKFRVDVRRWFPDNLYLTQTGWFDLSRFWIEQASVRGFADSDVREMHDIVGLRRGGTGAFHLCTEPGQPACHVGSCSGERAPFDLDNLPVAARLCSHCHSHVKERLVRRMLGAAVG